MIAHLIALISSPTGIIAGLGSIAGIVAAAYGVFKWITWRVTPSLDQKDQGVQVKTSSEQKQAEESGRPV